MDPITITFGILIAIIIMVNPFFGLLATIGLFSYPLISISNNPFFGTPIKIIGALTLVSTVLHNMTSNRKLTFLKLKNFRLFLMFLAYIYIGGLIQLGPFTKFNLIIFTSFAAHGFIVLSLVNTKKRFIMVIWTSLLTLCFACADAILFYLTHPGWISRLKATFLDPNYLAIVLLPHLALCYFLINSQKKFFLRVLLMAVFAVYVVALVLTSSRGGLIGFAVMFLAAIMKSKNKLVAIFCVVALSALMLNFMPDQVWERFDSTKTTMSNFESTSNVESTKRRMILAQAAWKMYLHNPIFGTGIGNYYFGHRQYSTLHAGRAHTMYLELMAELGTVGFWIFLSLLGATFKSLKLTAASKSDMSPYATGLIVGLVGFLVAALFLHAQQEKILWLCIFLAMALEQLLAKERAAPAAQVKKEKPAIEAAPVRTKWGKRKLGY